MFTSEGAAVAGPGDLPGYPQLTGQAERKIFGEDLLRLHGMDAQVMRANLAGGAGTLSGTNQTTLTWNANPESNLAKYEVVTRETTAADWTDTIDVGNVTTVTLDISKDNVQFGLRAVDKAGNRSPAAFPAVAN